MVQLFKSPSDKADDEFQKAYEKGVSLGRAYWPTAASHFQEASVHYAEAGDSKKANQSKALALLFTALNSRNADQWNQVSTAMSNCGSVDLNIGFSTNSDSLAKEAEIYSKELLAMSQFNPQSGSQSEATALRGLAQNYLELVGSNLDIWKLMGQTIDPQRRAYYLLGLASLTEANSVVDSDPKKSASLLSEAVAQLDLAGDDYRNVRPLTLQERDNATKTGKCWFCGREVQGLTFHYVALKADVSAYTKTLYGTGMPAAIEGDNIFACSTCYSAFRNVSDQIASMYYERAMQEITTLSKRVSDIETRLSRLESRVR
jgi:hypothetical protein